MQEESSYSPVLRREYQGWTSLVIYIPSFVSMCYSPEVSFGIWAFGMLSALTLVTNGQSVQSIAFPLMITQMQLVEGLQWIRAVDESTLAILGKLVLVLQPAAAFYEAKQYSLILPYIAIQALVEFMYGSRDLRFVIAEDGHFAWRWNSDPMSLQSLPYWIGLFLGASFILPREVSLVMMSLFVYFFVNHREYETYGSLWCVWVNLLWVYYLLR
jgi:hypothetical protein